MDNVGAVMRQQMDKTMAGLNKKLGALERQVSGTVRTVTDSVNTVRDSFDVKLQVRRRPWTLLAGAAAVGYLGSFLSPRRRGAPPPHNGAGDSMPPARAAAAESPGTGTNGGMNEADAARLIAEAGPGWLALWGGRFQPEITALRGIAVGALLELVREVVTKAASKSAAKLPEVTNKGAKGRPEVHAVPGRVRVKRRKAPSRLHPLEELTDGRIVGRPS